MAAKRTLSILASFVLVGLSLIAVVQAQDTSSTPSVTMDDILVKIGSLDIPQSEEVRILSILQQAIDEKSVDLDAAFAFLNDVETALENTQIEQNDAHDFIEALVKLSKSGLSAAQASELVQTQLNEGKSLDQIEEQLEVLTENDDEEDSDEDENDSDDDRDDNEDVSDDHDEDDEDDDEDDDGEDDDEDDDEDEEDDDDDDEDDD